MLVSSIIIIGIYSSVLENPYYINSQIYVHHNNSYHRNSRIPTKIKTRTTADNLFISSSSSSLSIIMSNHHYLHDEKLLDFIITIIINDVISNVSHIIRPIIIIIIIIKLVASIYVLLRSITLRYDFIHPSKWIKYFFEGLLQQQYVPHNYSYYIVSYRGWVSISTVTPSSAVHSIGFWMYPQQECDKSSQVKSRHTTIRWIE